jgi:hypothetical protein
MAWKLDRPPGARTVGHNADSAFRARLWRIAVVTTVSVALIGPFVILARLAHVRAEARQMQLPLVTDWSHHQMIYAAPSSLAEEFRLQNEPRYIQQFLRRNAATLQGAAPPDDGFLDRLRRRFESEYKLRADWGYSVPGPTTAATQVALDGVYPAKYGFSATAPPSCANDFLVMPTGVAGSTTKIAATATGSFSAVPTSGSLTIKNGGNTLTTSYYGASSTTTEATQVASQINSSGTGVGVAASSSGPTVTITASTAGAAGNNISLQASSAFDLTWGGSTSSSLQGGWDGTPSIAALNNLYAGSNGACTGPTVYWDYNTGGTVSTSPVFSINGSQVAFIQSSSGGVASLVVLKWSNSATFQTLTSSTTYPCTAPCMFTVPFSGSPNDTSSSPYYVYGADVLYVGDNSGVLHKFTPVLTGKPAEVTTGGWPLTVSSAATPDLTSPVYDSGSGNIFVGDASGNLHYVREVGSSTTIGGSCSTGSPPCLGATSIALGTGHTISGGPIVDGTNETVFAFDGDPGGTTAVIVQTDTALNRLNGSTGTTFPNSGSGNTVAPMHAGAFDNAYLSAAKGSGAGHLYVCAPDPDGHDYPALFRVSFTAKSDTDLPGSPTLTTLNSSADSGFVELTVNTTSGATCSPITEIYNSNADAEWLFFSLSDYSGGTSTTCGAVGQGCILSLDLTGLTWGSVSLSNFNEVATQVGPQYPSGSLYSSETRYAPPTSAIIVDNTASTSGTGKGQYSNIYFLWLPNATNLGNTTTYTLCNGVVASGGCSEKLTQSGLH